MSTAVRVEARDTVATVRLDGPSRRNAIGRSAWRAIPQAIAEAEAVPGCRLVVLRGGGGHFGAGADIKEFEEVFAARATTLTYFAEMEAAMRSIEDATRPTIAVIEGLCVGACVALALACDCRLAARGSSFAITPGKLGIAYPYGDVARVAFAIGESRAKAMMFSGKAIDVDTAMSYGLVDCVIDGDFEAGVTEYLGSIAACSPATARWTKRALAAIRSGASAAEAGYPAILADAVAGTDYKEGMAAFTSRRPPRFAEG